MYEKVNLSEKKFGSVYLIYRKSNETKTNVQPGWEFQSAFDYLTALKPTIEMDWTHQVKW